MKFESITFAGHSATFIYAGGKVIAIDPWLEGNPICPSELKNPKQIDLIILTHGHADHAGEAPRFAKHLGSQLIANWELSMIMVSEGVPEKNVIAMNKGGTVTWEGIRISLTHAFHSSSYDLPSGAVYAGEPCGIVLDDGTTPIYHAGDTALFKDMKLIKDQYKPKIALLPIGDRFTMGPVEAARAVKYLEPKVAIPIHYETFPILTGTAKEFQSACSEFDVEVVPLRPGGSYKI